MTGNLGTRTARYLALVTLAAVAIAALGWADARFEWRDVVQDVRILPDGGVEVRDERTLWTTQDFSEAFLCVRLRPGETLTLLPGESGAVSPGPPAQGLSQPCDGGTEVFVRQTHRVSERRVRFAYRLDGVLDVYSDVVQWYWNILERAPDRPVVIGYHLRVTTPGPMDLPYDAFVMRYANPEVPTVTLSEDRRVLEVRFQRVPPNEGVEIRYLMDPTLFTLKGAEPGLDRLLEQQLGVVLFDPLGALRPGGSHPSVASAAPLEGALLGLRSVAVSAYLPGYGLSINALSFARTDLADFTDQLVGVVAGLASLVEGLEEDDVVSVAWSGTDLDGRPARVLVRVRPGDPQGPEVLVNGVPR